MSAMDFKPLTNAPTMIARRLALRSSFVMRNTRANCPSLRSAEGTPSEIHGSVNKLMEKSKIFHLQ